MIKLIIDVVLFSCMFTLITGIVLAATHVLGRWKKPQLSADAEYWRKLVAEARSKADGLTNSRSKQTMIKVAQAYEQRAVKAGKELTPVKLTSEAAHATTRVHHASRRCGSVSVRGAVAGDAGDRIP